MKTAFIMTLVLLALVAGCRSMYVGNDTANYASIFYQIASMPLDAMLSGTHFSAMEQGFVWLCWIFSRISSNFSHFLIVTALFEFSSVGSWIWKNSRRPFISLLIFFCLFYTFFLTGIRQTIALCVVLYAYEDVKNRRFFWFIIKILVGMLFHFSALFFIPVYFIPLVFHSSGKTFTIMLVLLPALYVAREWLFPIIIGIFERYSDWRVLRHGEPVVMTLMILLVVLVSQIMLYVNPIWEREEFKKYCEYTNYIIVAVLTMPFVGMNFSIERAVLYYEIFVALQIEKIYGRFKKRNTRIIVVLVSISLLVILFIDNLRGSPYLYEFVGFDQLFS